MENAMPRTGGVYNAPAGTKGVPNTTIQSSPYNSFVDDLVADANNARPLTAGGTGATNATAARANLGLAIGTDVLAYNATTAFTRTLLDDTDAVTARTTLGAHDASNISAGTLNKDRLPGNQNATVFSNDVYIRSSSDIRLRYQTAVGTERAIAYHEAATDSYKINLYNNSGLFSKAFVISESGAITWNGLTVWTAGNDGAGSGLDADFLDGQSSAYYRDAGNLNAGTLADGRLPTSMAGKTFTSDITVGSGDTSVVVKSDGALKFPAQPDRHLSISRMRQLMTMTSGLLKTEEISTCRPSVAASCK
jgi:hypothetical protein